MSEGHCNDRVPPCGGRQHWRRYPRAGSERVAGKQGEGAHYKRRMNPKERQDVSATADRRGKSECARQTHEERGSALRMKT